MQAANLSKDSKTCIALVSMPRSGSTIVSSLLNSLDGSVILGEPHAMARAPRPEKMSDLPTICSTRYGEFYLRSSDPILDQISEFADRHGLWIYGFKECYVPMVDPPRLVDIYSEKVDIAAVIFRDPRKTYMSMRQLTHPAARMPRVDEFNRQFASLFELSEREDVGTILLDEFRKDPVAEIQRAIGIEISGEIEFKQYAGGGDPVGSSSTSVYKADKRAFYQGKDLYPSVFKYIDILERELGGIPDEAS